MSLETSAQIDSIVSENTNVCSHINIARVAIVILNYRTPQMVIDCLQSISTVLDVSLDRVIVVDNQSNDDSVNQIETLISHRGWEPWCRVIESPNNNGFSAGNNIGIECQRAHFYWLLNSDTIVRQGSLARLLETAQANCDAAIIAPRLTWPSGEPQVSRFPFDSPLSEFSSSAQSRLITRAFGNSGDPDEIDNESWVSFASVLIRGTAMKQIGPMDDGFFMYFEDVDYCRRALEAGWQIISDHSATVVHLRGGSSPVKRLSAELRRRPLYFYASRARYFAKFHGRAGLVVANLCWCLGRMLSWPRDVLGIRNRTACKAEWRDNWINTLNPFDGPKR